MENQVTSLVLSQKLERLKVKQESEFYWWIHADEVKLITNEQKLNLEVLRWVQDFYSAFTVAELGEILRKVKIGQIIERFYKVLGYQIKWEKFKKGKVITKSFSVLNYPSNEADARAKMLVYLIENKYIEL